MKPINSNWFVRARLKNRHIPLLVALGDTGNLNRAAEGLGISQPAISKLLKDLEDGLGVALFERHARGVVPTLYGETMIRHARRLQNTLESVYSEVDALRQGQQGHVRIGTILTPCAELLPEVIGLTKQRFPGLELSIRTGSSRDLMAILDDGELDFLVARFFAGGQQHDLNFEPLAEEPLRICARAGLVQGPLSRAELNAADWVLPPAGSVLRQEFDALFQRVGMRPPTKVVNAENLLMVTTLVEKNDVLTVLPRDVLAHYARYGMLAEIDVDPSIEAELNQGLMAYGIITKNQQLLSPAARNVLDLLRATARKMSLG
ncbi:LysR substrate-binding domain-containing protein [Pseudomonas stutzeri]|uniref:LysR family transcriptional regulator n=1 Tax=Stutzerimonas stutzeri TaxID=316 RepID=UPI00210DFFA4|nr:LysR substrate-binding domain-containing protein [Stutzerimonas stutzeri]MCQ4311614.1 LysR substrate-binding domain-containing protein [Stutzerimonas stutzeri]